HGQQLQRRAERAQVLLQQLGDAGHAAASLSCEAAAAAEACWQQERQALQQQAFHATQQLQHLHKQLAVRDAQCHEQQLQQQLLASL
ncbi:hypothetical protein, partial [Escherichia coli]|uniref:hypothetical protein n=1 Tax=Escherichia coli TaxID=562 RepID=UPI00273811D1